jgi:hypothetical protein
MDFVASNDGKIMSDKSEAIVACFETLVSIIESRFENRTRNYRIITSRSVSILCRLIYRLHACYMLHPSSFP